MEKMFPGGKLKRSWRSKVLAAAKFQMALKRSRKKREAKEEEERNASFLHRQLAIKRKERLERAQMAENDHDAPKSKLRAVRERPQLSGTVHVPLDFPLMAITIPDCVLHIVSRMPEGLVRLEANIDELEAKKVLPPQETKDKVQLPHLLALSQGGKNLALTDARIWRALQNACQGTLRSRPKNDSRQLRPTAAVAVWAGGLADPAGGQNITQLSLDCEHSATMSLNTALFNAYYEFERRNRPPGCSGLPSSTGGRAPSTLCHYHGPGWGPAVAGLAMALATEGGQTANRASRRHRTIRVAQVDLMKQPATSGQFATFRLATSTPARNSPQKKTRAVLLPTTKDSQQGAGSWERGRAGHHHLDIGAGKWDGERIDLCYHGFATQHMARHEEDMPGALPRLGAQTPRRLLREEGKSQNWHNQSAVTKTDGIDIGAPVAAYQADFIRINQADRISYPKIKSEASHANSREEVGGESQITSGSNHMHPVQALSIELDEFEPCSSLIVQENDFNQFDKSRPATPHNPRNQRLVAFRWPASLPDDPVATSGPPAARPGTAARSPTGTAAARPRRGARGAPSRPVPRGLPVGSWAGVEAPSPGEDRPRPTSPRCVGPCLDGGMAMSPRTRRVREGRGCLHEPSRSLSRESACHSPHRPHRPKSAMPQPAGNYQSPRQQKVSFFLSFLH